MKTSTYILSGTILGIAIIGTYIYVKNAKNPVSVPEPKKNNSIEEVYGEDIGVLKKEFLEQLEREKQIGSNLDQARIIVDQIKFIRNTEKKLNALFMIAPLQKKLQALGFTEVAEDPNPRML